jgi:hypothetical protein
VAYGTSLEGGNRRSKCVAMVVWAKADRIKAEYRQPEAAVNRQCWTRLVAPPRFWQLLSPLDAPDLTGEGGAKKGLPEKTKKKLLDPDTWKRDAGLVGTTIKLREALGDGLFEDHNIFKQFQDNDAFRRWLMDTIIGLTYEESSARPFPGFTTAG